MRHSHRPVALLPMFCAANDLRDCFLGFWLLLVVLGLTLAPLYLYGVSRSCCTFDGTSVTERTAGYRTGFERLTSLMEPRWPSDTATLRDSSIGINEILLKLVIWVNCPKTCLRTIEQDRLDCPLFFVLYSILLHSPAAKVVCSSKHDF